jgi:hypothetical protein
MKKNIFFVTMLLVTFIVTQAMAITFPTADDNTVVSSTGNGVIVVKAKGESDWRLIQYCQDNLRGGCGNNVVVKPFEVNGDTMKFQLDNGGVEDGQVAFNFKRNDAWLHIPDCRVKTGNNVGMGMSYRAADISESGGAHFVYVGSGISVWSPVSAGACGDNYAKAAAARTASSTRQSREEMSQTSSVVNSPDAQVVQTKQDVKITTKIKGNHNTVTNVVKQQKNTTMQRGSTVKVKGNNNKVTACTWNVNYTIQNIGAHPVAPNNCNGCHNQQVWNTFKNGCFQNCTTSVIKKEVNINKK